ncbi:PatB family C-S lyase [bacterium]|nr:PatB family C-S lyase [bacterium]
MQGGRVRTYDFDTVISRAGTSSIKWDRYGDRDVIPLWVADMDFPSPEGVCDALHARTGHGVFGYTAAPESLLETVLRRLSTLYSWKVEPDWLVWLPGLVSGINIACRAAGGEGDEIVTTVPVYPPFLTAPANMGRRCVTFPMDRGPDGRWRIDGDRLASCLTARTALLLLCSPHNPSGRLFSREELEQVLAVCERHDILVCSDEIHCDLIMDSALRHVPFATLPGAAKRTITLMAPSKTFNIPGLGCAFAVIPDRALRTTFLRAMEGIVPHVNLFGYAAAEAAYSGGDAWLAQVIDYLRRNRDEAFAGLRRIPGLEPVLPEATYLMWIDASGLGVDNPARFFEEAGVGLSDGGDFGADQFVRLNFACRRALLKTAIDRMTAAAERLRR